MSYEGDYVLCAVLCFSEIPWFPSTHGHRRCNTGRMYVYCLGWDWIGCITFAYRAEMSGFETSQASNEAANLTRTEILLQFRINVCLGTLQYMYIDVLLAIRYVLQI